MVEQTGSGASTHQAKVQKNAALLRWNICQSMCKKKNKRWNWVTFFSFLNKKGLLCKTCSAAKEASDFSEGKVWTEWKLDYFQHHIQQKSHLNSAGIVQRCKIRKWISTLLQGSAKDGEKRNELSHKRKSNLEQFEVLIDNILLAIKMNASVLFGSTNPRSYGKVCECTIKLAMQKLCLWICELNQWDNVQC